MDGIEVIEVSTPFRVGDVNSYLIRDDVIRLVDPGPDTDTAFKDLRSGINDAGLELGDIDEVLVTHPHLDHFGLVSRIHSDAGVSVICHRDAVEIISDFRGHYKRESSYFTGFLQMMGMPEKESSMIVDLPEPFVRLAPGTPVDAITGVSPGSVIGESVELEMIDSPGHAPGSFSFYSEDRGVAFTGDHLLADITPNPNLQMPDESGERPRSLVMYLEALTEMLSLDLDRAFPGHGEEVSRVNGRIEQVITFHEKRKERIHGLVESGSMTAYEVMKEMFPDVPQTEYFFGMSEVIGHLDILEDEGKVELVGDKVKRYRVID